MGRLRAHWGLAPPPIGIFDHHQHKYAKALIAANADGTRLTDAEARSVLREHLEIARSMTPIDVGDLT